MRAVVAAFYVGGPEPGCTVVIGRLGGFRTDLMPAFSRPRLCPQQLVHRLKFPLPH